MSTFLVLILLALTSFAAFADVSWNINCGSSSSYSDHNDIQWIGDNKKLVKAGKPRLVSSGYNSSNHVMDTLRVFTSKRGNCYSLKAAKGVKVLVRANFYYGDYDGKSSPPTFGLTIDGNDLITIQTSLERGKYDYYEVIYITGGDSMRVCFRRKYPKQFPFISSLRVQTLPFSMYPSLDLVHSLLLHGRYAFGSDRSISYPDDPYDRIWTPRNIPGKYNTTARSNASSIDTSTTMDKPPEATMANMVTTSDAAARSMEIPLLDNNYISSPPSPSPSSSPFPSHSPPPPPPPSSLYINMYFTEVTEGLNSTHKRSFNFSTNYQLAVQSLKVITPTYGSATELSLVYNVSVSMEKTTLTLVSTSDSSLPPLISAMEVFTVLKYTYPLPKTPLWKVIVGVIGTACTTLALRKSLEFLGPVGDILSCIINCGPS